MYVCVLDCSYNLGNMCSGSNRQPDNMIPINIVRGGGEIISIDGVKVGYTLNGRSTPKDRFSLFYNIFLNQLLYTVCFKHQCNTMRLF